MHRSENPEAVNILELLVRNPYNQNVPVDEFYRVINHFYRYEQADFNKAIKELDEAKLVDFVHDAGGDIETMSKVTEQGENLANFLFPSVFYRTIPDQPIFCP